MDIRQLRYFLEVANRVSFSKASTHLHISQPTLSMMVKNLEDELGVLLFDRSTRRIQLTDVGETVQFHAKNILQSMDNLRSAIDETVQMKKGTLKLGLPPVIGASFFSRIIAGFHKRYPGIKIELLEEGGKVIEQALLDGSIDLGVVVLPVNEDVFEAVPFVERKLLLAVNAQHPLAGRSEVFLEELKEEFFILFRKGFSLHDRIREACIRAGFEPKLASQSGQWDFIGEMVAANMGISFLPETICGKLDPERISVIPVIKPELQWNLAIIWRKNTNLSYVAKGWIEFVRNIDETSEAKTPRPV